MFCKSFLFNLIPCTQEKKRVEKNCWPCSSRNSYHVELENMPFYWNISQILVFFWHDLGTHCTKAPSRQSATNFRTKFEYDDFFFAHSKNSSSHLFLPSNSIQQYLEVISDGMKSELFVVFRMKRNAEFLAKLKAKVHVTEISYESIDNDLKQTTSSMGKKKPFFGKFQLRVYLIRKSKSFKIPREMRMRKKKTKVKSSFDIARMTCRFEQCSLWK